jgi:hypothetical protein
MNEVIYKNVARTLGLWCKVEDDRFCNAVDVENELPMSIEFFDNNHGVWIWTCQAVVGDLKEEGPDPSDLLMLNNNGLVWCYHALKQFEHAGVERLSLNLKYSFATPAKDAAFAEQLLTLVLGNMRKCALTVSRPLLEE